MKIQVLIHRQTEREPKSGTLRAFVVQGGRRGENLLSRYEFTAVDSAVCHIDDLLFRKYGSLANGLDIDYVVEGEHERPAT